MSNLKTGLSKGKYAAFAVVAALSVAGPASGQRLSDGDYELCSVYDREGEFAGYDSVCLADQRDAVRYDNRRAAEDAARSAAYGPYFCPVYANQGRGYAVSVPGPYGVPSYATADSAYGGRLCTARPVGYLSRGYY